MVLPILRMVDAPSRRSGRLRGPTSTVPLADAESLDRPLWVLTRGRPAICARVPLPTPLDRPRLPAMIRRHASGFRALLMAADALLAVGLFVGLSAWRFGSDWAVVWREIVPEPTAFLALYAIGWVVILAANGLYRPRARWSLRSEAVAIVKATVLMALLTVSVLFLFKMPDVSRLFLLGLFPATAAATIVMRAAIRRWMEHVRRQGRNSRFVLVLGAGPRGQAFAEKIEDHRELGLKVIGFLDGDLSIA